MSEIEIVKKKCPHCDKSISVNAKRCPYCQQDLRGWASRHPFLTFIAVIFFAPFVLTGMSGSSTTSTTSTSEPRVFNTEVNFTGSQFEISNLDENDCQNAKMEVNGGILKGGYTLDGYDLEKGHKYTVGAMQFTDKEGTRFNPFSIKPQKFTVACRGDNGLDGAFWYGEFN